MKHVQFCLLRIYWRLSTILKTNNKSVWSNVFWYIKVCIFWKCIQYTIHWDNTQILQISNFLKQNELVQKMPSFFFFHELFFFPLWFSYELKHKIRLSKTLCGIFHFQFCFIFIKVYIFTQQNAWTLWL